MANETAPLLTRKKLLLLDVDTNLASGAGVYVTSAAITLSKTNFKVVPKIGFAMRKPQGNYLGNYKAPVTQKPADFSFDAQLFYPTDSAGFELAIGALLKMAGFTGTGNGAYTPTSSMASRTYYSVRAAEDGRVKKVFGAQASLIFKFTVGAPATVTVNGQGVWDTAADSAMPAQPTIGLPWVTSAMTATHDTRGTSASGSVAAWPMINEITVSINNTISLREDVTKDAQISHAVITEREITVAIDPEARLVAALDTYGLLEAGTEKRLVFTLTNGTNTLSFVAPSAQRISIDDGDRGGKLTDPLTLQCNAFSGDDELSVTAT